VTETTLIRRGRPRDPQRRQAILLATLELVAAVGYERMTIDGIASRAGVSKPTIYRRWPRGKRELVVEAIRSRRGGVGQMPDTGSLRGDLLATIAQTTGELLADIHLASGIIMQLRESEELCELIREEVTTDERRRFEVPVERAVARGELAADLELSELFADVAPALIFTRVTMTRDDVGEAFAAELVDRVLIPILKKD
jgi:AcrR family transcriptional regulator